MLIAAALAYVYAVKPRVLRLCTLPLTLTPDLAGPGLRVLGNLGRGPVQQYNAIMRKLSTLLSINDNQLDLLQLLKRFSNAGSSSGSVMLPPVPFSNPAAVFH